VTIVRQNASGNQDKPDCHQKGHNGDSSVVSQFKIISVSSIRRDRASLALHEVF
jgi:hypothetical protein